MSRRQALEAERSYLGYWMWLCEDRSATLCCDGDPVDMEVLLSDITPLSSIARMRQDSGERCDGQVTEPRSCTFIELYTRDTIDNVHHA